MASTAGYQSPLSTLSRASRSRRPSPTNIQVPATAVTISSRTSRSSRAAIDLDDDSDDDAAVPQLSALARMLLDESPAKSEETARPAKSNIQSYSAASHANIPRRKLTWGKGPQPKKEPEEQAAEHEANTSANLSPTYQTAQDFVTPAARTRTRRPFTGGYTSASTGSSGSSTDANMEEDEKKEAGNTALDQGSLIQASTATITQSGLRWKRATRGLMPGLVGRPRRGGIRRESSGQGEKNEDIISESYNVGLATEEDAAGLGSPMRKEKQLDRMAHETRESIIAPSSPPSSYNRKSVPSSPNTEHLLEKFDQQLEDEAKAAYISSSEERRRPISFPLIARQRSQSYLEDEDEPVAEPPLVPRAPKDNKENMPPSMTRGPGPDVAKTSGSNTAVPQAETYVKESESLSLLAPAPPRQSPQRNALVSRGANAPLRPAPPPPPPKMNIMTTVTASAGAATAGNRAIGQRQRRAQVVVNGRVYHRLDAIGRGGSCKVYKVMAENNRIFAMKKVTFNEEHGESAILGYKGEIELLKRLEKVDRVVRLFDWEINDDRGVLTLLMECGETDLAKLLQAHYSHEDAQLDITFTRHYWREMLLCVQAVHSLNIIHSDLKPANFLVVQGRLKLIDFGIANAIQDDTVNVHRECQVGTVNYMSPEALTDVNAESGKTMQTISGGRLMKLGAPSDVWSLGIILYQMVYGKPPFAHLTHSFQRLNAILDPKFEIQYPPTGIGGEYVPKSAIYTIQDCLERDKNERATIAEFLSASDPFLHPDRVKDTMVEISEDTIMRLLENAAEQVEIHGMPSKEVFRMWASDVHGKLRKGNRMANKRERMNARRG